MQPATTNEVILKPAHQDHIQRWQERTNPNHDQQDQGIIWRLAESCQDTLQCLVNCLHSDPSSTVESHTLRRSLASLKLWCEGYGAITGTLDATLERSKGLRLTTLSVLHPLCRALARGSESSNPIQEVD